MVAWICTAIRSAYNAVERTRLEEEAKGGDRRASVAIRLIDNPPRSLAPLNFVAAVALVTAAATTTWLAFEGGGQANSVLSQFILVSIAGVLGATVANVLGIARARPISKMAAPSLSVLLAIASPFLSFGGWLAQRAKSPRPGAGGTERLTSDDIQIIVAEGNEERKLDEIAPEEREMIAGIIEMGTRTARDIMIPRPDVVGLEAAASFDQALDVAAKHGHSRLPVFEEDLDHIVGILHVKDFIQPLRHPEKVTSLRQLVRPVHYVPDTAKADDLLRDLLRNRIHMAIVVDEYGGTAGAVTIEDALEEIVGEIRDEYDAAEEPDYVSINNDEALFKARVPVGEVNEAMSINLPTEEGDTLGGLVYTRLGKMAKMGDHVPVGTVELTVTAVMGRRIKQVRVKKMNAVEKEGAVTDAAS